MEYGGSEQVHPRDPQPEPPAYRIQHPHREQGMAAEIEEVIVSTDPLDLQQLRPNLSQGLLGLPLRLLEPRPRIGIRLRRRQRTPVYLPARRQIGRAHV